MITVQIDTENETFVFDRPQYHYSFSFHDITSLVSILNKFSRISITVVS